MTDAELVSRALANPDGYAPIVERFERPLLRFIRSLSQLSQADAEDILQQVFLKAYQHLNDFDPQLKLSTWLYRIARNETISHWRRGQARPKEFELDETFVDGRIALQNEFAAELDRQLQAAEIQEILSLLKDEYREVLYLFYFEQKSYDEIADIVRRPPGTVAAQISRAKKSFAEMAARTGAAIRLNQLA